MYKHDTTRKPRTLHGLRSHRARRVDGWMENGEIIQVFKTPKGDLYQGVIDPNIPAIATLLIPVTQIRGILEGAIT